MLRKPWFGAPLRTCFFIFIFLFFVSLSRPVSGLRSDAMRGRIYNASRQPAAHPGAWALRASSSERNDTRGKRTRRRGKRRQREGEEKEKGEKELEERGRERQRVQKEGNKRMREDKQTRKHEENEKRRQERTKTHRK